MAGVPDPVPGPGQALIDVHIANITFVETQVRAGRAPNPAMLPRLPAILGNGVGGIVAAVAGKADPALVGRRSSPRPAARAAMPSGRWRGNARWARQGGASPA
jgi:NADPH:quinone reductase-like Zn-dependent oxidoreductase